MIYGWDIGDSNLDLANLLLIVASFSVYKARVRYNETNIFTPISLLFNHEIVKLNEITLKAANVPKILMENKNQWDELKVLLNIL